MTWGIASGIGPIMGGILSETISPHAPWFAAGAISFVSIFFFYLFIIQLKEKEINQPIQTIV